MELLENLAGGFGPDERRWSLVPMSDKGLDVLDELRDGVEGSPADRLTGKDTKPRFDKIHPRSSGGREMKMDAGMCGQPGLDVGGGVGRGVVDDRVQVTTREAASQLLEEAEEVWSAVCLRALADHLAGRHLQSSVEACQAISFVVVSLTSRYTRAKGQKGLRAVEGLDLGLLVHADDERVRRRVEVQPDDVNDLLFQVRISAELEGLDPMRLKVVGLPDAMNGGVGDTGLVGQLSGTPVAQALCGRLEGQRHDLCCLPWPEDPGPTRARLVRQTGRSLFREPAPDSADLDRRVADQPSHLCAGLSIGHQQDGAEVARLIGYTPVQISRIRRR